MEEREGERERKSILLDYHKVFHVYLFGCQNIICSEFKMIIFVISNYC
jgi:hypothetical protein